MKHKIHIAAGLLSFLFIASFWTSTLIAELFLAQGAVTNVKVMIVYAFIVFIPCMALTGASGWTLSGVSGGISGKRGAGGESPGGKNTTPLLARKRRRMPVIAMNGLLVLVPAALFLSYKAQAGEFDVWFYTIQGLELVAGALNLLMMGFNIRDGRQLRHRRI